MSKIEDNIQEFLTEIGVTNGMHLIVHASWKKIKDYFPELLAEEFIQGLKKKITNEGTIVFPAFTYCFKKKDNTHEVFDPSNSISKVGYLSEVFRKSDGVIRTLSPTHSFSVWGESTKQTNYLKSPQSPLGSNSILELLTKTKNSFVLMLGVHFESLTYGHYIESVSNVPWKDYSPWEYLGVEKKGVSINGEEVLIELPGCAKCFTSFEKYLTEKNKLDYLINKELDTCLISIDKIFKEGVDYFSRFPGKLLCKENHCKACDSRRTKYLALK